MFQHCTFILIHLCINKHICPLHVKNNAEIRLVRFKRNCPADSGKTPLIFNSEVLLLTFPLLLVAFGGLKLQPCVAAPINIQLNDRD